MEDIEGVKSHNLKAVLVFMDFKKALDERVRKKTAADSTSL